MRAIFAALALAGALIPSAVAREREPVIRAAQMSRDVTDAVRKQRERSRAQVDDSKSEGRR